MSGVNDRAILREGWISCWHGPHFLVTSAKEAMVLPRLVGFSARFLKSYAQIF